MKVTEVKVYTGQDCKTYYTEYGFQDALLDALNTGKDNIHFIDNENKLIVLNLKTNANVHVDCRDLDAQDLPKIISTKQAVNDIDWSKVKPYTKVLVYDCDEDEWKRAYFLEYRNVTHASYVAPCANYPYIVTFHDTWVEPDPDGIAFKQCRLATGADL